jgi:hypothetical protein
MNLELQVVCLLVENKDTGKLCVQKMNRIAIILTI